MQGLSKDSKIGTLTRVKLTWISLPLSGLGYSKDGNSGPEALVE